MIPLPRLFIFLALISFASISAVLFTPALPEIATSFGISEGVAQWTMSLFLVGYALGQLPYGPLANRFGRKKTIFIGIGLAIIGTLIAVSAVDFWVLLLGRFIQALGAAVGLKITFTMISDLYTGASATKVIAIVTLAFGIMPGLGVAIGGFITVLWGWKGCFVFMALYSLLLALLALTLPETAKTLDKEALQLKKIARGYLHQFKDPFLLLHALMVGLTAANTYTFAALSPYLSVQLMGLSPAQFGLWSLIPSLGVVAGTFTTRKMAGKLNPRIAMISGILLILIAWVVLSLSFAKGYFNPYTLFIPVFFLNLGGNIIWVNASSKGLSEATDKSNASAVLQFINVGTAALGTFLVGLFSPHWIGLLPTAFALIILLLFATWLKLRKHYFGSLAG